MGGMRCITDDVSVLGRRLISGEDVVAVVADTRKPLQSFFENLKSKLAFDKEDADAFQALEFERAAVLVLEEATRLQVRNIIDVRRTSMAEFSKALAPVRSSSARRFLAAIAEAQKVAEEDRHLVEGLDQEDADLFSPHQFPKAILSDPIVQWLLAAVSYDLIRQEELQAVGID
jgi:hypothetical protein